MVKTPDCLSGITGPIPVCSAKGTIMATRFRPPVFTGTMGGITKGNPEL